MPVAARKRINFAQSSDVNFSNRYAISLPDAVPAEQLTEGQRKHQAERLLSEYRKFLANRPEFESVGPKHDRVAFAMQTAGHCNLWVARRNS